MKGGREGGRVVEAGRKMRQERKTSYHSPVWSLHHDRWTSSIESSVIVIFTLDGFFINCIKLFVILIYVFVSAYFYDNVAIL